MNNNEYLATMKDIQSSLLVYIEQEDNTEENFERLQGLINDTIKKHKYFINSLLRLITEIGNNHYRGNFFFSKLEQIILIIKENIKQSFSKFELFNIFKSNKRLLLFIIKEKLIEMDENIAQKIITGIKNPKYFAPELKPYKNVIKFPSKSENNNDYFSEEEDNNNDLDDKRQMGENERYLAALIRNDLIEDFIIYISKNNYSLNNTIKVSIYETNQFLIEKKESTLIEYAAFFGSIQIFKYLKMNNAVLNQSIWTYVIHGLHPEIFNIIEENKFVEKNELIFNACFKESIKCHHNEFAYYFMNNYLNFEKVKKII